MNKIELGKIANIRTGKLDANASSEDGRYPFFTCSKEPLSINSYSYDCECVLVAGNGDLNVKYFNGKFDAYQRTYIIEAKDKSELSVKYLYNFIDSKMDFIRSQSIGGVIKYIKLGDLTSLKIPLPPLTTQQTISSELDLLNSLINKQKAQLTELDRLAQSVFYDMFGDPVENEKGWEVRKLGEVVKPKSAIKRATREIKISEKISYIDISSIDNSINKITTFTEFIFKDAPSRAQQVIEIGDIIISLVRPNLNNVAVLSENYYNSVASSGFCVLRPNSINTQFLFYIVKGDKYRNYLSARTSGANYPAVREEDVKSFDLIIPPLSLQTAFAERIEKIEAQKALVKQSIAQSEQLLASRMQYYFE